MLVDVATAIKITGTPNTLPEIAGYNEVKLWKA